MDQLINKRVIFILITLVIVLIVGAFLIAFIFTLSSPSTKSSNNISRPNGEQDIQRQLEELESIGKAQNVQPLTEDEIRQQLEELETSRQQTGVEPLSDAELQKQLEELETLRSQSEN